MSVWWFIRQGGTVLLSAILILCAASLLIGNHLLLKWRQPKNHIPLPAPRAKEASWYRAAGNYPRVQMDSELDDTEVWHRDAVRAELLSGAIRQAD